MSTTRAESIQTLTQTHATLVRLTTGLADAVLDFRPTSDEWSIREILAHLVDDEMFVMRLRLARIAKENHPRLTPHDERVWYATRNTSHDTLDELLADFGQQRAASLGIIAFLREADWARDGYQPEVGIMSAEHWLTHWADHDTTHVRQIEATLAAYTARNLP